MHLSFPLFVAAALVSTRAVSAIKHYLGSDLGWTSCTTGWGDCRVDRDYLTHTQGQIRIGDAGTTYAKGIVAHAAGSVDFTLSAGIYKTLHVCMGISRYSSDGSCGSAGAYAGMQVTDGAGAVLIPREVKYGPDEASCHSVDIGAVTSFRLVADLNGRRHCDLSTWADAYVTSDSLATPSPTGSPTGSPTASPTASPTVSPTVPGPLNALNLTAVTADFSTNSEVSLNYTMGVGRSYQSALMQKGCEVPVNDSLYTASEIMEPIGDSLQRLTLTYDFNLAEVETSDIWNSSSSKLEVCNTVDMIVYGPDDNSTADDLIMFQNEQEIEILIDLVADFNLNVTLAEGKTESANDTVDFQNAVRGYKCNGGDLGDETTFSEDLTELAPNDELNICVVSNDATIEIERLENMESKQGDVKVPIVALGSPVVAAITSVAPPSGPTTEMVVSTRLPLNEFDFANGRNLTISGSVLLKLAGRRLRGDRQLRQLQDSAADDGPQESAFQVQVVLRAEDGFGPGDKVPLGSSAGHAASKYAATFGLIAIVALSLM